MFPQLTCFWLVSEHWSLKGERGVRFFIRTNIFHIILTNFSKIIIDVQIVKSVYFYNICKKCFGKTFIFYHKCRLLCSKLPNLSTQYMRRVFLVTTFYDNGISWKKILFGWVFALNIVLFSGGIEVEHWLKMDLAIDGFRNCPWFGLWGFSKSQINE